MPWWLWALLGAWIGASLAALIVGALLRHIDGGDR
jgi:hypothetical protein